MLIDIFLDKWVTNISVSTNIILFLQVGQYCSARNNLRAYAFEKKINEKRHRWKLRFLYATDRTRRSRGVIEEKRQSEKRKSNRTDSSRDRTYDGKKSLSFLVHGIPRESIKLSNETM